MIEAERKLSGQEMIMILKFICDRRYDGENCQKWLEETVWNRKHTRYEKKEAD